jgi:hypothetical protein
MGVQQSRLGLDLALATRGFQFLEGEADAPDLVDLLKPLGPPVPSRPNGPPIDLLIGKPQAYARRRSLSAIHGTQPFPFHTDGAHFRDPPRWLALRYVRSSPSLTQTHLIDFADIVLSGASRSLLTTDVWQISNGCGGFLATALSTSPDHVRLRYDAGCMTPAHERFATSSVILDDALQNAAVKTITWKSQGDTLVLDNWRMLHSRGAVVGTEVNLPRLQRVLVGGCH